VARPGIPICLTLTDQRAQRPEAALPITASPMALTGLSASGPQEDPLARRIHGNAVSLVGVQRASAWNSMSFTSAGR
jgi:hypothetical protein